MHASRSLWSHCTVVSTLIGHKLPIASCYSGTSFEMNEIGMELFLVSLQEGTPAGGRDFQLLPQITNVFCLPHDGIAQ